MMIGKNDHSLNNAVYTKTIRERNEEMTGNLQNNAFSTQAYSVNISDEAKNLFSFATGSAGNISTGNRLTRDEELAVLQDNIDHYQKMNENFRLTGNPINPDDENARIDAIVDNFDKGSLDASQTVRNNNIQVSNENIGGIIKSSSGLENASNNVQYTPVTEIRTKHYAWTEADGIKETLTRTDELKEQQDNVKNAIASDIGKTIESILKPYDTYEEAYENLYAKNGVDYSYSINEETMYIDMTGKSVQGAFGSLANQLNNYMEEFGAGDSYFGNLKNALNEVDPSNTNSLVLQIQSMIERVQSGNAIDTGSDAFQSDVQNAVASTYNEIDVEETDTKQKKSEKESDEQFEGVSFTESERRKALQEGRLLDEMLGKKSDYKTETAGDILNARRQEQPNDEMSEKIRNVDKFENTTEPFVFESESMQTGTRLSEEEIASQTTIYEAWKNIESKLVLNIPSETPDTILQ